jgi:hypothetical protein
MYRLEVKLHPIGGGRSILAAAAYRAGSRLAERDAGTLAAAAYRTGEAQEEGGRVHDFTRKRGILASEIHAPQHTPERLLDRGCLWREVEAAERKKDGTPRQQARGSREAILSIPRGLTLEQGIDLVRGWVSEQCVMRGMIADVAWHRIKARDRSENLHAHVLTSTREVLPEGAGKEGRGGFGNKVRAFDDKAMLQAWRDSWADHCNWALEQAGRAERVSSRSLEAQRRQAVERGDFTAAASLDRLPTIPLGRAAIAMECGGRTSERGARLRAIEEQNRRTRAIYRQVEGLGAGAQRTFLALRQRAGSAVEALEMLRGKARAAMARVVERLMPERSRQRSRDAGLDLGR